MLTFTIKIAFSYGFTFSLYQNKCIRTCCRHRVRSDRFPAKKKKKLVAARRSLRSGGRHLHPPGSLGSGPAVRILASWAFVWAIKWAGCQNLLLPVSRGMKNRGHQRGAKSPVTLLDQVREPALARFTFFYRESILNVIYQERLF